MRPFAERSGVKEHFEVGTGAGPRGHCRLIDQLLPAGRESLAA